MVIPRTWFTRWVRSVHGGMQLAPIGGELIWGNSSYSVEDEFNENKDAETYGKILNYVEGEPIYSNCHLQESGIVDIEMTDDGDIDFHVQINKDGDHEIFDNRICNTSTNDDYEPHPFDFDYVCCKKPTEKQEKIIN